MRVHNEGAAFSFLATAGGWQRWFFTGLGVVATIAMVWMLKKHPGQKLFGFAIACILGGAVGNVIDRVLYGYVVDFLDFYYASIHFPRSTLPTAASPWVQPASSWMKCCACAAETKHANTSPKNSWHC